MKQPGQNEAEEVRKDGIRGRDHNDRKKLFRNRAGFTRTGNLPW